MTLDVVAVETFTHGRLNRDDSETQRQLNAALGAARRYCGWHVTPVATNETITLDGPGERILVLPTLALGSVSSIAEDGATVDLADVRTSARGLIVKNNGALWTDKLGGIQVTLTHGYSEASDFESVVLSVIDRGEFSTSKTPVAIGPFRYSEPLVSVLPFSNAERAVLDFYKLEKRP